ncbi:hypothetical protein [Dictyobacter halimunensis]
MVLLSAQPIRANPLITTFKSQFRFNLIVAILFFVLTFAFLLAVCIYVHFDQAKMPQLIRNELYILFPVLVMVLNSVRGFRQWRYWQRIESLRVAVANGDLASTAAEQPDANATALPLPYKMKLSYNWDSI